MNSLREQKIQLYLMRLTTYLRISGMSRREEEEVRQEVRLHLEALVATQEFEGKSEAETVEAALHQFGDPRKIGQKMARSWWKKRKRQWVADNAAREAAKPASQRRRERAIRWLHSFISGAGLAVLICMTLGPSPPVGTPFQLWVKFLTFAAAIGVVTGFIGALHPADMKEKLFTFTRREPEEKSEGNRLAGISLPPLPKGATIRQRLRRVFTLGTLRWVQRHQKNLARKQLVSSPPRLDFMEVKASLFAYCFVLVILALLPLGPETKRLWVTLSWMNMADTLSQLFWRRLMAKRRSARM
jgi:hypothetical protein